MSDNPIYARLMRAGTWYTRPEARRMPLWIAGVTSALALLALLFDPSQASTLGIVPLLILGITVVLILLSPPAVLLITSLMVGREVTREDFDLLRLTRVTSGSIVAGYQDAVLTHLERLWTITAGLVPAIAISLTHTLLALSFGTSRWNPANSVDIVTTLVLAFLVACFAIGIAAAEMYSLWYTALRLGVWIGCRWGSRAPFVAGAVIMAVIAVVFAFFFTSTITRCNAPYCLVPIAIPFGALMIGDRTVQWAKRAIEQR